MKWRQTEARGDFTFRAELCFSNSCELAIFMALVCQKTYFREEIKDEYVILQQSEGFNRIGDAINDSSSNPADSRAEPCVRVTPGLLTLASQVGIPSTTISRNC